MGSVYFFQPCALLGRVGKTESIQRRILVGFQTHPEAPLMQHSASSTLFSDRHFHAFFPASLLLTAPDFSN